MFIFIILTLVAAIAWHNVLLVAIFAIGQFLACAWYCLSYIPYARSVTVFQHDGGISPHFPRLGYCFFHHTLLILRFTFLICTGALPRAALDPALASTNSTRTIFFVLDIQNTLVLFVCIVANLFIALFCGLQTYCCQIRIPSSSILIKLFETQLIEVASRPNWGYFRLGTMADDNATQNPQPAAPTENAAVKD